MLTELVRSRGPQKAPLTAAPMTAAPPQFYTAMFSPQLGHAFVLAAAAVAWLACRWPFPSSRRRRRAARLSTSAPQRGSSSRFHAPPFPPIADDWQPSFCVVRSRPDPTRSRELRSHTLKVGAPSYSVSKAAAVAYAMNLAAHHGDKGVRVHCVCPQVRPLAYLQGVHRGRYVAGWSKAHARENTMDNAVETPSPPLCTITPTRRCVCVKAVATAMTGIPDGEATAHRDGSRLSPTAKAGTAAEGVLAADAVAALIGDAIQVRALSTAHRALHKFSIFSLLLLLLLLLLPAAFAAAAFAAFAGRPPAHGPATPPGWFHMVGFSRLVSLHSHGLPSPVSAFLHNSLLSSPLPSLLP